MRPWLLLACAAALSAQQTPVILISLDTLRADRLGSYGYKPAKTPHLDRWAGEGTVYEQASTPVPLTLPAHTALMTSTLPFENGVESNASTVPPGIFTLASFFHSRGYRTGAFVGSIFLEKQLGLDVGFNTYDSPFDFGAFSRLSGEALAAGTAKRERRPGPLVLRAATQWLTAQGNQPTFTFVHLFDMHKPWAQASYDAQLAAVDTMVGNFRQSLERSGLWDKALVILVADHGEGLGDHGESDHGYFLYESTVHIPLLVHWPKSDPTHPQRVAEPVSLIDVAPTIVEYLKLPKPASFHGRSFLDASPRPVVSASVYAHDSFGWAPLRSLRQGQLKYIDAPREELYDLAGDPGEKRNLAANRKPDAAKMKAQLARLQKVSSASPATNRNEALKSLGYIGPGPKARAVMPPADPKDRLPILIQYDAALSLMASGRTAAAVAAFRKILMADPGNLLARRDLGVGLIELKRFEEAISELRTVAATAVEDYVTRYELGLALEATGQLPAAVDQFRAACQLATGAAQCSVALQRVQAKLPK